MSKRSGVWWTSDKIIRRGWGALLLAVACMSSACSDKPHAPYAVADLPLDRAGATRNITFDVPPSGRDVSRGLMVALHYASGTPGVADFLRMREPPIGIEVDEVSSTGSVRVPTKDYRGILEARGHAYPIASGALPASPRDSRLHQYASGAGTADVLVAWFPVQEGKRYTVTLSTVADLPTFRDVPIRVSVDDLFNTGK